MRLIYNERNPLGILLTSFEITYHVWSTLIPLIILFCFFLSIAFHSSFLTHFRLLTLLSLVHLGLMPCISSFNLWTVHLSLFEFHMHFVLTVGWKWRWTTLSPFLYPKTKMEVPYLHFCSHYQNNLDRWSK